MIHIHYIKLEEELREGVFKSYLKQLPAAMQNRVLRYRRWQDRQSALFGKLLLLNGMKTVSFPAFKLDDLQYSAFKRPFVEGALDFNISHSGAYTMCAISEEKRVGVDIEEIKAIPITDFKDQFSEKEIQAMLDSADVYKSFYKLWTQKEAFLKAIGTGLYLPLHKVFIEENAIFFENIQWYLTSLEVDDNYAAHVCAEVKNPEIRLKMIEIEQLANY
jgi:4'-phosphopantetheinyl transferase